MRAPVNGIEIEYRVDGRVKAPAVVLSHSLATNMSMWGPQVPVLARDYLVISYDMRGHGRSDAPAGPYDFRMLAQDVIGLLDHLDIDRAAFVGISIGGMIGQMLAIHHRSRLAAALLCSTTSQISEQVRGLWDQRIAAVEAGGMASQVAATLDRWFTEPYRAAHPDIMDWVGEMIGTTPVAGFVGCGRAIQNLDVAGGLGRITTPTLVLPGEKDPGMPPTVSEAVHRAIAGSEFAIVPDASHLANIQQPEAFNRLAGRFLRKHL
ncbi:MAG: 3-oxoadipate enol-lactonase [Dongiaceae bacterium]